MPKCLFDFEFLMKLLILRVDSQRLDRQTRNMDQAQYSEFCESRQLSFGKMFLFLDPSCKGFASGCACFRVCFSNSFHPSRTVCS